MLLAWAADHDRLLLTHDLRTMKDFAYDRVAAGLPMPGVLLLRDRLPIGRAIEEVLIVVLCSQENEYRDRVVFLPL